MKPTDVVLSENPSIATRLRNIGPQHTHPAREAATYAAAQARYDTAYYDAYVEQVAILARQAGLTHAVMRTTESVSRVGLTTETWGGTRSALLAAKAHQEIHLDALKY